MFQKSVRKLSYIEGVGGRLYLKASSRSGVQIFQTLFAHKGACTLFAHQ